MAKETALNEIGEMLEHVVKHMATKDDVRETIHAEVPGIVRDQSKGIRSEVASIRRDLDRLSESVANMVGYRKEIDHALERITAIEKQLGIKKIAA